MNHVSVSPTDGTGPTQGQRKTLTRVAKVCYSVLNILSEKDRQLWEKIKSPDNPLHHLLPPTRDRVLRNRGHSFIIPRIRTERFKSIFINRNLLSFR